MTEKEMEEQLLPVDSVARRKIGNMREIRMEFPLASQINLTSASGAVCVAESVGIIWLPLRPVVTKFITAISFE